MSTTILARGLTWRFIAALLAGLAILLLVPYLLYRASVIPIRVTYESHRNSTATLLPNGDVLVIGNTDRSDIERYDPRRDRWQRVGSLNHWFLMHTATLLADGRILVAGEEFDAPDFFQIYDPIAGTWSEAAHSPHPFYQHTATLLHDGSVLFAGGAQSGSSSAARFDPATNQWLPVASMISPRAGHTATLLRDGRVLVVGGANSRGGTTAELYDPAADHWRTATSPQAGHGRFTASLLADGRVLIAGGNEQGTSEVYDPVTDTWQLVGALATPRYEHTATLLADGQVLVVGGQPAYSALTSRKAFDGLDSAERFDLSTIAAGQLDRPRYGHAATSLPGGRVLVVDGYNSIYGGSAEQFDPRTGRWGMAGGITVQSFWAPLGLLHWSWLSLAL